MKKKSRQNDPKPSVPGYIVTFSDMITLLLTFFVMLLSMAETQVENHKFMAGINSFRTAVADFGISGFLVSRNSGLDMEHSKSKYPVDEGEDEKDDRSVDAETEMLKRVMLDIERMMKISPSHTAGMDKTFLQTGVLFSNHSASLESKAQKKIARLCEQIRINYAFQEPILYVLGLAADESTEELKWITSAQRAMSVADFIRSELPDDLKWPIYSWGAGNGGEWIGHDGQVTEKTQIIVVVLTEKK
jgi:flagellar motor protein MotB